MTFPELGQTPEEPARPSKAPDASSDRGRLDHTGSLRGKQQRVQYSISYSFWERGRAMHIRARVRKRKPMKKRHEELISCIRELSKSGVLTPEWHARAEIWVNSIDLAMNDPNPDVLRQVITMICKDLIKPGVLR